MLGESDAEEMAHGPAPLDRHGLVPLDRHGLTLDASDAAEMAHGLAPLDRHDLCAFTCLGSVVKEKAH